MQICFSNKFAKFIVKGYKFAFKFLNVNLFKRLIQKFVLYLRKLARKITKIKLAIISSLCSELCVLVLCILKENISE